MRNVQNCSIEGSRLTPVPYCTYVNTIQNVIKHLDILNLLLANVFCAA